MPAAILIYVSENSFPKTVFPNQFHQNGKTIFQKRFSKNCFPKRFFHIWFSKKEFSSCQSSGYIVLYFASMAARLDTPWSTPSGSGVTCSSIRKRSNIVKEKVWKQRKRSKIATKILQRCLQVTIVFNAPAVEVKLKSRRGNQRQTKSTRANRHGETLITSGKHRSKTYFQQI